MTNRIDKKFRELKAQKKSAFIAFITAGFPSLGATEKLVLGLEKRGVDIIELGVPFSDPLADGPIIQASSLYSLKRKTNLSKILSLVKKIRKQTQIPICLMTYVNPVLAMGEKEFLLRARQSGVDGIIVPDLPPEEASGLIRHARKQAVHTIFFLSPTSGINRIKYVAKRSRGFIYYVSLTGVTGARKSLETDLKSRIGMIKRQAKLPVCVGFGVSTAEQVSRVKALADGVIVGSAIIDKIRANLKRPDMLKRALDFVKSINV